MESDLAAKSAQRILVLNGGSSSLKAALFDLGAPPCRIASCRVDRIGGSDGRITFTSKQSSQQMTTGVPDHEAALQHILDCLLKETEPSRIAAVGHRIVHGGPKYSAAQIVTPNLLVDLKALEPFDPEHLPAEIGLMESASRRMTGAQQVVCFDTAFHHDLPAVARRIPIPRKYDAVGVRRYGFHGLSFSYLMEQLCELDPKEYQGRVILAHLGNGSSLAAVSNGRCIDTSMCLTPAAGVTMGTRSGDIDPGLIAYLARTTGMTLEGFNHMIHLESGLIGVSETTGDMQNLLEMEYTDPRAAEAIALYCYQMQKWIGAFAAALGGLDTLVFSGGIGERSWQVRERICRHLAFLGVVLSADKNKENAPIISSEALGVKIRVIATDEEQMIAREVASILQERSV